MSRTTNKHDATTRHNTGTSALLCNVLLLDGLTTSAEIVKLMPSLGQVVQFSRLFTIHCDGCAPSRSSLERWLMFARSQHWRCESRGTRQTLDIMKLSFKWIHAMCRRVTVCLFITKSYIQFQSTLHNTIAPRGRAPAVFARQSSGISCSEWFPLSCRSDKRCWQCCLIIIMQVFTARVTLQMSDLVARMARGTATV